jgi:hypothetical protein
VAHRAAGFADAASAHFRSSCRLNPKLFAQIVAIAKPCQDHTRDYDVRVRDIATLLIHLLTTVARLLRPGGARSVVAESLLLRQQLLILNRAVLRLDPLRTPPARRDRAETGDAPGVSPGARETQVPGPVLAEAAWYPGPERPVRGAHWGARDLERKLLQFKAYYNRERTDTSLGGVTPTATAENSARRPLHLSQYRWQSHCRRLFQLPATS